MGQKGGPIQSTILMFQTAFLSIQIWYEVVQNKSEVSVFQLRWQNIGNLTIDWIFLFDPQTASMQIPVIFISSLVQMYSQSYMEGDPHKVRFFSYLSLFSFFMLLLITGENLLVLFVGWEGKINCLKWCNDLYIYKWSIMLQIDKKKEGLKDKNINNSGSKRIGPHCFEIHAIIIGSLQGDGHLEKRNNTYRLKIEQSNKNVEYLMWLHKQFSQRLYCNKIKPKQKKRIRKTGVFFHLQFNTYSFNSFEYYHNIFYKKIQNRYIKVIPELSSTQIDRNQQSPQTLAIWFMDDGSITANKTARIATNCFTLSGDPKDLCIVQRYLYDIKATAIKAGKGKGHIIYIWKESRFALEKIITPYMISSMLYKLKK